MKNKRPDYPVKMKTFLPGVLMLITCLLLSYSGQAQQAQANPQEQLVKDKQTYALIKQLRLQNPNDQNLSIAIKRASMVNNPELYPSVTPAELEEMKIQLRATMDEVIMINEYMTNSGDSYDTAKTKVAKDIETAKLQKATEEKKAVQNPQNVRRYANGDPIIEVSSTE